MTNAETELLTREEAAVWLKTTTRTVDKLIAAQRIQVLRPFGRRAVRIELGELRRFVRECRGGTPPP